MARDALGAHARDELGITPTLEARPIQAALASAASFILGAAIPLIVVALVPAASLLIAVPASSLVCERASGRWLRGRAALEWRPALYGSASGARWPWASRQAQALCSARWFEIQAPSLASASRTMTSLKLSPSFRVARSCSTYCGSSQTY